jgi:hypothetical protein
VLALRRGGNRDIKFLGDPGRAWSIRIAPTEATLPSKGDRNFNTWFSQTRVASTRCLSFLPDSRIPVASFPPYALNWHVLDPLEALTSCPSHVDSAHLAYRYQYWIGPPNHHRGSTCHAHSGRHAANLRESRSGREVV